MKRFLSTREVADFLSVNEKMVYNLVAEKGLPASKITGKWLFPRHLVEQWVETHTLNFPKYDRDLPPHKGILIIIGSNDPLLDSAISLFNTKYTEHTAVFGNLGSMGGLRALRHDRCHMASSHLLQDDKEEYNFAFADQTMEKMPAVITFCRREQGILVEKGNPKEINRISDFGKPGIKIVNRPLSTGTRLLFDREIKKAGLIGEKIQGYRMELDRHLDVGLEIFSGRADAGLAIRSVASLLNLDFLPLRWERFDLMITKERFFDPEVQLFIGMLHEIEFKTLAESFDGYDILHCGKMVFPEK